MLPESLMAEAERQAAAELLVKLAEEEGVDINALSDEEIAELLAAVEGGDDEFTEKVAEADYLGRVMAHAYVDELGQIGEAIEKTASGGDFEEMVEQRALELLEESGWI